MTECSGNWGYGRPWKGGFRGSEGLKRREPPKGGEAVTEETHQSEYRKEEEKEKNRHPPSEDGLKERVKKLSLQMVKGLNMK